MTVRHRPSAAAAAAYWLHRFDALFSGTPQPAPPGVDPAAWSALAAAWRGEPPQDEAAPWAAALREAAAVRAGQCPAGSGTAAALAATRRFWRAASACIPAGPLEALAHRRDLADWQAVADPAGLAGDVMRHGRTVEQVAAEVFGPTGPPPPLAGLLEPGTTATPHRDGYQPRVGAVRRRDTARGDGQE